MTCFCPIHCCCVVASLPAHVTYVWWQFKLICWPIQIDLLTNSNWFAEQFKLIYWAIQIDLLTNSNWFAEECAFCSVAKRWWLVGYVAFGRWLGNGCFMPCCVMWGQKIVERRWKPMHHRRAREMPCLRYLVGGCSPTTRAATGTNAVAAPYRWWL